MSENSSGTIDQSTVSFLRKPILIAGMLGGLLGGVASFAATRLIKPVVAATPPTTKDQSTADARRIVEAYLQEVIEGKNDEFLAHVKLGYTFLSDEEFNNAKVNFKNNRLSAGVFGKPLKEFELLQEIPLSPNLIQFVYLERFEHGGMIWRFIMYNGKEHWLIAYLNWTPDSLKAFAP
jgi:hypothetical protein